MLPPPLFLALLSLFTLSFALPPPSLLIPSLAHPLTISTPPPPLRHPFPTTCYIPSPFPNTITKHDCHLALDSLLVVPNLTERMLWSASSSHRVIQARWQGGDCVIEVIAKYHIAQDIFSLLDVSVGAFQIVDACVEAGGWVGGWQDVGKQRVFQVAVMHGNGLSHYSQTLGAQGSEGGV